MTKQNASSIRRTKDREVRTKFMPSFKKLSEQLYNTGKIADSFHGYEIPCGEVIDGYGRKWQLQARAVVAKKKMIRSNELKPLIDKKDILLRIRVFAKYLIDWASK